MPREIKDTKDFLKLCDRSKGAKVIVKHNLNSVKFKVRCARYLYTMVMHDPQKAQRMKSALAAKLSVEEVHRKSRAASKSKSARKSGGGARSA